jgi:hypothetical protein
MFNSLLEAWPRSGESGPGFVVLKETIRQAKQQGAVRPGDPAHLARAVWALVHGASMLQRDSTESQFIRFSNEVLRSGLNDAHRPTSSAPATSPRSKSSERNA